jgi:gas vesicle protein
MLFAPKSGKQVRSELKDKAAEGTEYLRQSAAQIQDRTTEMADKVAAAVADQKARLKGAVEAGKSAYRDVVNARA